MEGAPSLPRTAFLPVEIPLRFRRFFETAKAKSAFGSNRARLSKNAVAFLCVAREAGGSTRGNPPCTRFLWVSAQPKQRFI